MKQETKKVDGAVRVILREQGYLDCGHFFTPDEIEKIRKTVPRFGVEPTFNLGYLQYYDRDVLDKVKDPSLYKNLPAINLYTSTGTLYGGWDIFIYESVNRSHFIFSIVYWGD